MINWQAIVANNYKSLKNIKVNKNTNNEKNSWYNKEQTLNLSSGKIKSS